MALTKKQQQLIFDLAGDNPVARAICSCLQGRERNWSNHSAEKLLSFAHMHTPDGEPPTYQGVLEVLKKFDEFELGSFKVGRKGKKTRIEWAEGISLKEIGLAGRSITEELDDEYEAAGIPKPSSSTNSTPTTLKGLVQHQYKLRPGLELPIYVPEDLSPVEARRLAAFVGSLSME